MSVLNPYSSPEADPLEVNQPCPKCGEAMQRGQLCSSSRVSWVYEKASKAKKFFGGDPIGEAKTGFLGCKHDGYHCPDCRLYLLGS